ncbi:glyoxalase [Flavobacterium sp. L1I52]|uniref:Glyoxalase n=1 Tax=Flavobacterium pokkalii TaxID=1940408 RepID=A0ABR7UPC0_9FLAO|nr:VOC family protein [Flavobacterium pokkalii]MBD0724742.1 glyoxalase [Flavobacterium pokkalii]
MKIKFKKLDHVQVCIPIGEEERARNFYCNILGLQELERPKSIQNIAGFWLKIADISLHIGTENTEGISKRHPAFVVEDSILIKKYLIDKGVRIQEEQEIPGINRFSFYDPWNNRIELIEKTPNFL